MQNIKYKQLVLKYYRLGHPVIIIFSTLLFF